MKFSTVVASLLAAILAGVLAMAAHDFARGDQELPWAVPATWFIVFSFATLQAVFIGLPLLALVEYFNRLNLLYSSLIGAITASVPWLLVMVSASTPVALQHAFELAAYGAIGGLIGSLVLRRLSPNNSSKPTPLRGAA